MHTRCHKLQRSDAEHVPTISGENRDRKLVLRKIHVFHSASFFKDALQIQPCNDLFLGEGVEIRLCNNSSELSPYQHSTSASSNPSTDHNLCNPTRRMSKAVRSMRPCKQSQMLISHAQVTCLTAKITEGAQNVKVAKGFLEGHSS